MNDFTQRFASKIPWVQFANVSGQTIPPYSLVRAVKWYFPDPTRAIAATFLSPYFDATYATPPTSSESVSPSKYNNPETLYITGNLATPPTTPGSGPNGIAARPIEYPQLVALDVPQDPQDRIGRLVGPGSTNFKASRDSLCFVMLSLPQQGYALVRVYSGPYRAWLPVQNSTLGEILVTPFIEPYFDAGNLLLSNVQWPVFNPFANVNTQNTGANLRCTFDFVEHNWELIAAVPNCALGN